jgi:hypothetical protein
VATRAASRNSKGSLAMSPPAATTLAAVSSALSTQKYVFHVAEAARLDLIPATSPLLRPPEVSKKDEVVVWRRAKRYVSSEPGGITSSYSHPNRPA